MSPRAPRGAPLMTAMGANTRLQIMSGAGEIGEALAVETPGPSTAADLEKVVAGGGQRARLGVVPRHRPAAPLQAPLHHGRTVLGVVGQEGGSPMDPASGAAAVGPASGRGREALGEKAFWGRFLINDGMTS